MSIRWVPVPSGESAAARKNDKRDLPSVAFPSEYVPHTLSASPRLNTGRQQRPFNGILGNTCEEHLFDI